ncbi:MAG: hypothetical protein ACE5EM_11335 [Sphingomonadales bacterium]
MRKVRFFLIWAPLLLVLGACGDPTTEAIGVLTRTVDTQINQLNGKLQAGEIRNAVMLRSYVGQVKAKRPEFGELLDNLARDAKADGPAIQRLRERWEVATTKPEQIGDKFAVKEELTALKTATTPEIFNETLIDIINVVADLSDGALPRLNQQARDARDAENGPGSHLVGNPQYGRWQSSGGQSFWMWYGMYRMFGDIWGRPYYYHRWHYNRPWSYYNDYGRGLYSSRADRANRSRVAQVNDRAVKQYGAQTRRNPSVYSSRVNRNHTPSRATSQARANARRGSSYAASHRSSSRSRGRGGK